ncbi:MAG: NADH:ubiquinone reductase (Na(+)-transporting) subunit B [Paludibacteraceae bacterium]|nr:NADH:ubiquinone reductase (Na(+)-transporting) subunit B [Paludibacteraceae bacterium]
MKWLYNIVEKLRPQFDEGGKFHALHSLFDGFDTFLFTPNSTAKRNAAQIHDASDSKRTMIIVVLALIPAMLFGMYNIGYQHFLATGEIVTGGLTWALFWKAFAFGLLALLPYIIVSYVVGLGIEFTVAQWKHEEIAEGFLVTGFLIPLIVPIDTPLWMVAIATAFAVIFAKEIFGGTGYNIFNVALITRAFLFFAYPTKMSGDKVFVRTEGTWGWDGGQTLVDGFSGATPLGQIATAQDPAIALTNTVGEPISFLGAMNGLYPGSVGETCVWAILLGACLLLMTGVASWKTMLSIFVGGGLMAWIFNVSGIDNAAANTPWYMHLVLGGFCFGAVFMATDPVTSARTECGKWIYGFLIGVLAITIRVLNPGYPEGMMLAILLMNAFAPLIDWCVVRVNINKRMKRATLNK